MGLGHRLSKKLRDFDIDVRALEQWDLEIENIEPKGKVFLLETDVGAKCLKVMNKSYEEMEAGFLILEHLAQRDFKNIPRYIRTRYGEPFVKEEKSYYCISDWIHGRDLNWNQKDDLVGGAIQLANLHQASRNFHLPHESLNSPGYENWAEKFQSIIEKMEQIRSKVNLTSSFLKSHEIMLSRAIVAGNILENSGYKMFRKQAEQDYCFCHGAYNEHHIIIGPSEKFYLTGFDEWIRDMRVLDLAKYIFFAALVNDWNYQVATLIIENYHRKFPLYLAELEFLQAYLCFPFQYWQILKNLVRSGGGKNSVGEMVNACLKHEDKKQKFLMELTQWIEQRY